MDQPFVEALRFRHLPVGIRISVSRAGQESGVIPRNSHALQLQVGEDFSNILSAHARGRHLRHWRVLLDQILRFEIRPELGGDLRLHGSVIRKDLLFGSAAHHQGRGNIGCCRELQSGGSKVYSMIGRHIQKLLPAPRSGDSTNSADPLVIFLRSTRLMNSPRAPSETFLPANAEIPRSTTTDSSRSNPCCSA
jgi:hypothetical protein